MSLAPGAESWCLVCGMKDGAVRLFNLLPSGNSWPDDRWGQELGRFRTSSGGGMGLRDTTTIAATSLKAHLDATPTTSLERVVFYGYQLQEYVVTLEVLYELFDLDESDYDPEVWAMVRSRGQE